MRIKKTVLRLVRKYRTRCPFQISEHKNIPVLKEPLGAIFGYTNTYKRIPIIHINSELDKPMQRFVCAHELGHVVLHQKINTPFMRAHTLFSIDKIEKEANTFAVELLMPDDAVYEHETIFKAATACGVPLEAALLKKANTLFTQSLK